MDDEQQLHSSITDAVLFIKVGYEVKEADKVTMLRNIYSTTANRSDDPLVFFQTHKHHATTQTLRFTLHMAQCMYRQP